MTDLPERTVEEGRTTSDAFEPPQSRDRADHVDLNRRTRYPGSLSHLVNAVGY